MKDMNKFKAGDAYRLTAYGILGITAAIHSPFWAIMMATAVFLIAAIRTHQEIQEAKNS